MNSIYAYYRLPDSDRITHIVQQDGQPEMLDSFAELCGKHGFVVAPFDTLSNPVVLIHPDEVEQISVDGLSADVPLMTVPEATDEEKNDYQVDFSNFHSQLTAGGFDKIVLSRSSEIEKSVEISPLQLFYKACKLYPRMFVALVSTPQCGIWLTATPEILLEGNAGQYHTIALAGTMRKGAGEWSAKNRLEQQYVASYIAECLEHVTTHFYESDPATVSAGQLQHLCTDFRFSLFDEQHLGYLLQLLHPTPAVCGLPREKVFQFIKHNEHAARQYYSGFMGPLLFNGDTHLYVSLRCMQITDDKYKLYAGGGLLKESQFQSEWLETEAKLETMRALFK